MSTADAIHRLPTVSASQALKELRDTRKSIITSGSPTLDALLSGPVTATKLLPTESSGVPRGQVVDLHGPPGAGKTAFGLSLCASALKNGEAAVWIATGAPLVKTRLQDFLAPSNASSPARDLANLPAGFHYFTAPTLPHVLALFTHPPPSFPPRNTGVIVIDTISAPFEAAYTRTGRRHTNSEDARWESGRRFAVMEDLVGKLGRLAAVHGLIVLLTRQVSTRFKHGGPAMLVPSMSSSNIDVKVATQLCIFRDYPPYGYTGNAGESCSDEAIRYISVVKSNGTNHGTIGERSLRVVAFVIRKDGLHELEADSRPTSSPQFDSPVEAARVPVPVLEIGDSDDEELDLGSDGDYGWKDEDEIEADILVGPADTVVPDNPDSD